MAIFVFNQNVKLDSLVQYSNLGESENLIVTTQFLFTNERKLLMSIFPQTVFMTFADFLTDSEMASIDEESYTSSSISKEDYLKNIKKRKNLLVIKKVLNTVDTKKRYIFSDGLGIDISEWKRNGFTYLKCESYYNQKKSIKPVIKDFLKRIPGAKKIKRYIKKDSFSFEPSEVYIANYQNRKFVFLGKMNRIGYRLDIDFEPSIDECEKLNRGEFETKETCTYMTTWHEQYKCNVPDDDQYEVRWAQDGYLPPNYSHKDYFFKPGNVKYYCWDMLGTKLFENQGLPYEMIPFRKKLFLPQPIFPTEVKNVLIVASGSGDWTALKNRSDDDIMVDAFVQMARKFPNIRFTYRCHPTWIHPLNVGVNAINRVHDYFMWLNLPNLVLSSNIPVANDKDGFQFSFSRSSLDEDLENADLVFGEHSISMIDAAFKRIPFASVNLTERRNFFVGINDLGFPKCTSVYEIEEMLKEGMSDVFKNQFLEAIKNYNEMTDEEGTY